MDKRFWGILAAIVIIFGAVFVINNHKQSAAPNTSKGSAGVTSHIEGKGSSGVNLTEYGDYQCPACGQYYPIVKQVYAKYSDQIFFQFRNFPLFQIHPNAIAGARAAEAADLQGKYWEMHDLLYEGQQDWSTQSDPTTSFNQYAKQLGLDTTKFQADFKSSLVNDRIQSDIKKGNQLNIDSTPTFFIDGKKISNPNSVDAFNKVIDTAIQQKTGKPAATSTPTPAPAAAQ
jgi:protein-disulfide isomerase